jgi:hypothetical protein
MTGRQKIGMMDVTVPSPEIVVFFSVLICTLSSSSRAVLHPTFLLAKAKAIGWSGVSAARLAIAVNVSQGCAEA